MAISVLEAELGELQVRHHIGNLVDRVQAALVKDQNDSKQGELKRERAEKIIGTQQQQGYFRIASCKFFSGALYASGRTDRICTGPRVNDGAGGGATGLD